MAAGQKVRVIIVDDIAETRENVRKLLQFEADIEVIGAAKSGKEGIEFSKEQDPDVILKYKYGNRHFWSRGYYVSTVGLNEATIAKYVREQDKHDQMMDRISTKEYEDPFTG